MTDQREILLDVSDLTFGWPGEVDLLDIPQFRLERRSRVFLEGPSGSGKSTFLGLMTGVLTPGQGCIMFDRTDIASLSAGKRDTLRADRMGVIFQLFNLLPYLSLLDNVLLPCRFSALKRKHAIAKSGSIDAEARRLLDRLGLSDEHLLHRKVGNLSVGQQQRVAAARALIGAPDLVIADEPTSALDTASRDVFLNLLIEETEAANAALLFVSHDLALGENFSERLSMTQINRPAVGAMT